MDHTLLELTGCGQSGPLHRRGRWLLAVSV
ncbi:lipoprotein [Jannaschia sp. CCS1]